jgi:CubicO group peptidase (beta-lactamase class C family)
LAAASDLASRVHQAPVTLDDGLAVATPSSAGFDERALGEVLRNVQDGTVNIHSVLVMRRGKLAAELYRSGRDRSVYSVWSSCHSFSQADQHDMRSVSKSVVSLLYGILLARHEVPSLETSVASLYPEFPDLDDPARRLIRIRHLLTMTTGLAWNEPSPVHRASSTDEFGLFIHRCAYRYVFDRDVVAAPGRHFVYSGGATAVLAEIMERSTGKSLREIARERLFTPLGIRNWQWTGNVYGTPVAPVGLRLTPRDMIKIGAMVLARGQWQGRQVVPADWIAQSTKSEIDASPVGGYGFQWWTTSTDRQGKALPVTAAIGNGGQRLFIVPALDLVVATTAGDYGDPAISVPLNRLLNEIAHAAI